MAWVELSRDHFRILAQSTLALHIRPCVLLLVCASLFSSQSKYSGHLYASLLSYLSLEIKLASGFHDTFDVI